MTAEVVKIILLLVSAVGCHASCDSSMCCDNHSWCRFWASVGECETDPGRMRSSCRASCQFCRSDGQPRSMSNQAPAHEEARVVPTSLAFQVVDAPTRCLDIQRTSASLASTLMASESLVVDREDVTSKRVFSSGQMSSDKGRFGCAFTQSETTASDCRSSRSACYNAVFRTADGTCNNIDRPLLGATASAFRRDRPPVYDDSDSAPTGSLGNNLPSPRQVSRLLLSSGQQVTDNNGNALLMQFGQFIVHDMVRTSLSPSCPFSGCSQPSAVCFPIKVSPDDQRFGGSCSQPPCCLPFVRASPVCGSHPKTQLNEQTAFIDGSQIYGASVIDTERLRNGAFLKSVNFDNKKYLPFDLNRCQSFDNCTVNFDTGDSRVTMFVGLTALHTIFLREHNRIATHLMRINPRWGLDRIFQETRKIVGAQLQHITYKEWLPKILGRSHAFSLLGEYRGYDNSTNEPLENFSKHFSLHFTVDPSISEQFAFGAMRFGHGMLPEAMLRLNSQNQPISAGQLRFVEAVFRPAKLLFEGGVDPILRGLMNAAVKLPQRVTTSATENMFGFTDLAAMNIQRGRDVGLPSYNVWRHFCGLQWAETFEDFLSEIPHQALIDKLKKLYFAPSVMDLYAGILIEEPVSNGLVGPTASCLLADQFKRLRNGDRFYYENPGIFKRDQLNELRKVSLARVLCDNGDDFEFAPFDSFDFGSSHLPCDTLPSMDLNRWME